MKSPIAFSQVIDAQDDGLLVAEEGALLEVHPAAPEGGSAEEQHSAEKAAAATGMTWAQLCRQLLLCSYLFFHIYDT